MWPLKIKANSRVAARRLMSLASARREEMRDARSKRPLSAIPDNQLGSDRGTKPNCSWHRSDPKHFELSDHHRYLLSDERMRGNVSCLGAMANQR